MKHLAALSFLALWLSLSPASNAQVRPRVSGLENNEEYVGMLEKEASMKTSQDSLNNIISKTRNEFRDNRDERDKYADEILRLEKEIFDVRNTLGILTSRISAIEQDYILKSFMEAADTTAHVETEPAAPEKIRFKDLARNEEFSQLLSVSDYNTLLNVQKMELPAESMVSQYFDNYDGIVRLGFEYEQAGNAELADSIYKSYLALRTLNSQLTESLAEMWNPVFDNKLYAYNYVIEKTGDSKLLSEMEKKAINLRDSMLAVRGNAASTEIISYVYGRKLLMDYEAKLAELFHLTEAADSIAAAITSLNRFCRRFPPVVITERNFLNYADIEFPTPPKYNSRNPIPEVEIYPRGTIYRILLGSYGRIQPVSVFRGVYPVGVLIDDEGNYNYYAGGFQTYEQAIEAAGQLIKAGLRNMQIAVWIDGQYYLP